VLCGCLLVGGVEGMGGLCGGVGGMSGGGG